MNGEKKQRQTNIEKESDRQTKSLEINRERERGRNKQMDSQNDRRQKIKK
jgi:hypothetical protein